jgi:hypothetical protein
MRAIAVCAVIALLAGCGGAPPALRATSANTYQVRATIHDVASEQVAAREALAARSTELCHGQYWFLMEQFSTYYKEPALIWDISCAPPGTARFEKGTR